MTGVLLVCGGRHYLNRFMVFAALDAAAKRMSITAIRHGDCRDQDGWQQGADMLAGEWARARGVLEQARPADWYGCGKTAGPRHNAEMLSEGGVVFCVAFPGGRGTADMCGRVEGAELPLWLPCKHPPSWMDP